MYPNNDIFRPGFDNGLYWEDADGEPYEDIFDDASVRDIYETTDSIRERLFKYIDLIIEKRIAYGSSIPIEFRNYVQYKTILETGLILCENNIKSYSVIDLTKSSIAELVPGSYICLINNEGDIKLYNIPFNITSYNDNSTYLSFNQKAYKDFKKKHYTFNHDFIKSYELLGTELMQSSTFLDSNIFTSNNRYIIDDLDSTIHKPRILQVGLTEMLFGASYTMLSGISKFMNGVDKSLRTQTKAIRQSVLKVDDTLNSILKRINSISLSTKHKILDTRVVQVIFYDKTDIIVSGVSFYLELNRKLDSVKRIGRSKTEKNSIEQEKNQNTKKQIKKN
jgi:hypothetical protein